MRHRRVFAALLLTMFLGAVDSLKRCAPIPVHEPIDDAPVAVARLDPRNC